MIPFVPFDKIPRLNRLCTITEKIDGTNGIVHIEIVSPLLQDTPDYLRGCVAQGDEFFVWAGSRTRWVTPGKEDNHGFAAWVRDNAPELVAKLGPGTHYGEWWGGNIQRGYGVQDERFSLFNTARWSDPAVRPACCGVVPVLYEGLFMRGSAEMCLAELAIGGSRAAPGFMDPEGIVVFHHAANSLFKATIKGDEEGKHTEAHVKKERPPKQPRDPSKGGRRKEQLPFDGSDRRKPK